MAQLRDHRIAQMYLREKLHGMPGKVGEMLLRQLVGVGQVIWLGIGRNAQVSYGVDELKVELGQGIVQDRHVGSLSPVTKRDLLLTQLLGLERDHDIQLNLRQGTLCSTEDATRIATTMGLPDSYVPPGLQSENIRTKGLDLSSTPAGTTLVFLSPDGIVSPVSLFVTGHHAPCGIPGAAIMRYYRERGWPDFRPSVDYATAAAGRRGLTFMVRTPERGERIIPRDCFVAAFAGET